MKPFIPILVATAGLVLHAAPVDAGNGSQNRVDVTHGHFVMLQGGADQGLDISGTAIMFRTERNGGSTTVRVRARGLLANTTYPAHVHNLPCSASPNPGGGHYQEVVGGLVNATNEMWPVITTDDKGRGVGHAEHSFRARPEAQSIVVHEPTNTSIRVACLDLS